MKRRIANKKPCPCGCGNRLGRCFFNKKNISRRTEIAYKAGHPGVSQHKMIKLWIQEIR